MVELEYYGGNCILVSTKNTKMWVDAGVKTVKGLNVPKLKNCVQLSTEKDFLAEGSDVLNLEGPGEYEVGVFSVQGVGVCRHLDDPTKKAKNTTVYKIQVSDLRILLVGNVLGSSMNDAVLEELGVVDVIILPVGGNGYTLDATSAAQLVKKSGASLVIPLHYAEDGVDYEVPQDGLDIFLSELGVGSEVVDKLKLKSASDIPESIAVKVISRKK